MNASSPEGLKVQADTFGTSSIPSVLSPEDVADAAMRRLRAEIVDKYGTVKAFAPLLHGIGYEALNDNLAGRSDMRLSVLYEILGLLGMDQVEFARRVLQDAEGHQES
jgi:hypothetical protein